MASQAMEAVRRHVLSNSVRVEGLFQDYDPLRTGMNPIPRRFGKKGVDVFSKIRLPVTFEATPGFDPFHPPSPMRREVPFYDAMLGRLPTCLAGADVYISIFVFFRPIRLCHHRRDVASLPPFSRN